jgi:hypothetical protein
MTKLLLKRLVVGVVVVGVLLIGSPAASPHGSAQWIADGRYQSPEDGTLCCGEQDCHPVDPSTVRMLEGDYEVPLPGAGAAIRYPVDWTQESENAFAWVCIWGGKVRCFFMPPVGV